MQRSLCQLILLNGMMTDANKPGVEKVCCALTQNSWLSQPLTQIRAHEDLGIEDVKLLSPGNAFMVKGWNRSVCCLTVCYAAYQNPHLLQARFCGLLLCNTLQKNMFASHEHAGHARPCPRAPCLHPNWVCSTTCTHVYSSVPLLNILFMFCAGASARSMALL